jgi:hypothetical protein
MTRRHLAFVALGALLGCGGGKPLVGIEEDPSPVLKRGQFIVNVGDAQHETKCQTDDVMYDEAGEPTLLRDDGEFGFICFRDTEFGISMQVERFEELGSSFDVTDDERVSFFFEVPQGAETLGLGSNRAETIRFEGEYDAVARRVQATLSAEFAVGTDTKLGPLAEPVEMVLDFDFAAE